MRHLGDITQISGYEVPPVDCLIGGSPCQDLSVAGKRAGLKHGELGDEETTRSGLFMEQVRLLKEIRVNGEIDGRTDRLGRFLVWENVPGAFSSGNPKGADFQAVLEELIKIVQPEAPVVPIPSKGWPNAGALLDGDGHWSLAYRVLDAQYFGVAQRRRRIALVLDTRGVSAPKILFECKSLRRNTEQSIEERKAAAGTAIESTGEAGSYTLKIRGGVSVDANGKSAGKGALVQNDLSATKGCAQDQTLFAAEDKTYQKITGSVCAKMSAGYCGQDAYSDMFIAPPISNE